MRMLQQLELIISGTKRKSNFVKNFQRRKVAFGVVDPTTKKYFGLKLLYTI